ncbi:MAG: hypothetical protein IPK07_05780 [Deltaproteobacteria bacterium]|nr:hypothetical protein [Deltaproteobacteria bacterium]
MNRTRARIAGLALALGAARCGADGAPPPHAIPGTTARFELAASAGFFDLPFPNDLDREADGTLDFHDFPVPDASPVAFLLRRYVALADRARGAGPNSALFFAFDGPLDPASLPATPADSLDASASLQVVNVDPASPGFGERLPLTWKFRAEAQAYGPANLLAILPRLGFPLRRATRYAAIVTREARGADGAPLGRPLALEELERGRVPNAGERGAAALALHGPAFEALEAAGVARERIAAMSVFTSQDAVAGELALRRWFLANEADPVPSAPLVRTDLFDDYCVYESRVRVPIFQDGTPPYALEGGEIRFDSAGAPLVQRHKDVRFAVTVPRTAPMPAAGWPIVLYEHGGSGTYREVIERGALPDPAPGSGPARVLARRAIAAFGKDGATNVNRGNPTGGLLFFNFLNPVAFRDNVRQSAFEQTVAVRMLRALAFDASDCPGADASAAADGLVRYDPGHVLFMGHSTGSTVGPVFVAVEPAVEGAIFSGSGVSYIRQVQYKSQPLPLAPVVRLLLAPDEELDDFRPFLTVIQTAWEEAEPLSYEPYVIREPLEGARSRNVFASFGILDTYNPPLAENPGVAALGLDAVGPLLDDAVREELELSGHALVEAPLRANVIGRDGAPVTAAVRQYRADPATGEGHYVLFQLEEGQHDYGCFLASLVRDGVATVPRATNRADAPCE